MRCFWRLVLQQFHKLLIIVENHVASSSYVTIELTIVMSQDYVIKYWWHVEMLLTSSIIPYLNILYPHMGPPIKSALQDPHHLNPALGTEHYFGGGPSYALEITTNLQTLLHFPITIDSWMYTCSNIWSLNIVQTGCLPQHHASLH